MQQLGPSGGVSCSDAPNGPASDEGAIRGGRPERGSARASFPLCPSTARLVLSWSCGDGTAPHRIPILLLPQRRGGGRAEKMWTR